MRASEKLTEFVRDARIAGRAPADIRNAMQGAGWTPQEISDAMNAWADTDFTPPVPRPVAVASARDAFFYGLMFTSLAISAWFVTSLLFDLIDLWMRDVDQGASGYLRRSLRWSIAMLAVFSPLFFVLNYKNVKATRSDPAMRRSSIRKWFGYTTLFLASIALLGDLVYVIYTALEGALTAKIFAKAAVVAITASCIFLYFRSETEEPIHVAG